MQEINVLGKKVYLLPVIHGLDGEGKRVEDAFYKIKPSCLAIGVPPEDIEMMDKIKGEKDFHLSLQHQYFLMNLAKYGKISLPPSDIKIACEISKKENVPLHAIDIDDEEYVDLLTKNVSLFSLLRHSRKIKKLSKKTFYAKNVEDFVFEWDEYINSIKSFRVIENERERRMAKNIFLLAQKYEKILAILPLERYEGVMKKLKEEAER